MGYYRIAERENVQTLKIQTKMLATCIDPSLNRTAKLHYLSVTKGLDLLAFIENLAEIN